MKYHDKLLLKHGNYADNNNCEKSLTTIEIPCPLDKYGKECDKSCYCKTNDCNDTMLGIPENGICRECNRNKYFKPNEFSIENEPRICIDRQKMEISIKMFVSFIQDKDLPIICQYKSRPSATSNSTTIRYNGYELNTTYFEKIERTENQLKMKYNFFKEFLKINSPINFTITCLVDDVENKLKGNFTESFYFDGQFCKRIKPDLEVFFSQNEKSILVKSKFNDSDFACMSNMSANTFLFVELYNNEKDQFYFNKSISIMESREFTLDIPENRSLILKSYYVYNDQHLHNSESIPKEYISIKGIKMVSNQEKKNLLMALSISFTLILVIVISLVLIILFIQRRQLKRRNELLSMREFFEKRKRTPYDVATESIKDKKLSRNFDLESSFSNHKTPERIPIKLKDIEKRIDFLESGNGRHFQSEYKSIPKDSDNTFETASNSVNMIKNRFKNILPYDKNMVVLKEQPGVENSDYINASYVDGYDRKKKFIATQGPLKNTLGDFWRMIWQEQITIIVALTKLIEQNRRKCDKYWPEEGVNIYADIEVEHKSTTKLANYLVRTFKITYQKDVRIVEQHHYIAWPDHGIPSNPTAFVDFWRKIRSRYTRKNTLDPILVHCSAGVGRTGTFLALDYLIQQAEIEGLIDIIDCVKTLRAQRIYSVQTLDQYIFIYYTLYEFGIYANPTVTCKEFEAKCKQMTELTDSSVHREFRFLKKNIRPIDIGRECTVAMSSANAEANRLEHILPRDAERVKLKSLVEERGDYINAVEATSYSRQVGYILTQTPLTTTIHEFVRLLWDYNIDCIVKCHSEIAENEGRFWDNFESTDPFHMNLLRSDKKGDNLIVRDFQLKWNEKSKKIRQLEFIDWSESSNLPTLNQLNEAIVELRKYQRQTNDGTVLVYCPDGATRSGSFCILNTTIERIDLDREIDIFQASRVVAEVRPQVITSEKTYKQFYMLIKSYIDAHSDYANYE